MGFEVYSNLIGDPVDIEFTCAGDVWATGVVNEVRSEVVNDMAVVGTGVGSVTLTAPGVDDEFYNEVLALSGASGQLDYTFTSFAPVNAQGLFNSAGSFTVVPEPGGLSWVLPFWPEW